MPDKLFLEVVHSPGLAHLSYMVGHRGEAAVIDARRDGQIYLDLARRHDCQITHIFETDKNEDYITGSLELQRRTGARILHGEGLDWGFGETVSDGDTFQFGGIRLGILATPGHTDESISITLADTSFSEEPVAVFTGDALFLGDVGRTDFYPDRAEEVAGLLYDSIFKKLLPLGDHVLLYPAHGAGSVCGSGMAAREFSSLGYERRNNPALQVSGRDEFIDNKVSEKHYKPPYFKQMEQYNKAGSAPALQVLPEPKAMDPGTFEQARDDGAIVLDIREPEAFAGAFVPGSLNIPANMIAAYAGWLLPFDQDLLLVVADPSDIPGVVRSLIRLGYDRVAGYLRGGLTAWEVTGRPLDSIGVMPAEELDRRLGSDQPPTVLDVRKDGEYQAGHLRNSEHVFLGELPDQAGQFVSEDRPVVTFCGSGRRASIAASILRRKGVANVANSLGSMAACKAVGCDIQS